MPSTAEHTHAIWKKLAHHQLYLACSGGIDSMVLLDLLLRLTYHVTVIHVNYQLRGLESDEDEAFIRRLCVKRDVDLLVRKIDLKQELEAGGNLQNRAREIRYDWFTEILGADSNNRILLAHHQDDQVETFFQHLARKSGILGMSCMKMEHHGIIRPLLYFTKSEIATYAKNHDLEWREDRSNAGNAYSRNRLRNEFLPFVDAKLPGLRSSVLQLIDQFQSTQRDLEEKVAPLLAVIHKEGRLSTALFDELTQEAQVELLRQLNLSASYAARMNNLTQRGKHIPIERPIYASIVRDQEHFTFLQKAANTRQLLIQKVDSLPEKFGKTCIYLDADKIQGTLTIRAWQDGDRMSPIGMNGSQLISDIIKDAKIDAQEKKSTLVVHDDIHIHWCVGLKIGRLAIAQSTTTDILRCSVIASVAEESEVQ